MIRSTQSAFGATYSAKPYAAASYTAPEYTNVSAPSSGVSIKALVPWAIGGLLIGGAVYLLRK